MFLNMLQMEEDEGLEGRATCSPVKEFNFLIYFIPFIASSCLDFLMAVAAVFLSLALAVLVP